MNQKNRKNILPAVLLLLITSCSMLGPVYVKMGYRTDSKDTIRKIRLVVRKPEGEKKLALLLSAIAGEHIRVKKNYSISASLIKEAKEKITCGKPEGALVFTVEEVMTEGTYVSIYIKGTLKRCGDNMLIWRGEGRYDGEPGDKRLENLIRQYRREYGKTANLYTEPLYFLLRDIIDTLPDPQPVAGN